MRIGSEKDTKIMRKGKTKGAEKERRVGKSLRRFKEEGDERIIRIRKGREGVNN